MRVYDFWPTVGFILIHKDISCGMAAYYANWMWLGTGCLWASGKTGDGYTDGGHWAVYHDAYSGWVGHRKLVSRTTGWAQDLWHLGGLDLFGMVHGHTHV